MNHLHLAPWVERLSEARLLVVGDLMLDRFVSGRIGRISPEAPVPVLKSESTRLALGGAGNVVRNLASLGCRVCFISAAGGDEPGRQVERLLHELADVEWEIVSENDRPTTVKTRFIADRQQVLRVDFETTQPLQPQTQQRILDHVRRRMGDCQVVLLSDYGKGLLSDRLLLETIDHARKEGRAVIVDPKGRDYRRYRGAGLLTPNLKELGEAVGHPLSGDAEIVEAALRLVDSCSLEALLATRGPDGMSLVESGGQVIHLKAQAREVFDVSGAGDTVLSVLGAARAAGASLAMAAELANLAAGIVVGKVGTAVTHRADLLKAIHQRERSTAEAKVLGLEAAVDQVDVWRRQGHSVGFTNGVFDLLHAGHLTVLQRAAESCDRLVVGLNSDASVRRIKGSDPVQNEATRSAIVASLESVRAVVIFNEETPGLALEALRPDVLIKGANYREEDVVGADLVRGWGGRVVLAEIKGNGSAAIEELTKGTF